MNSGQAAGVAHRWSTSVQPTTSLTSLRTAVEPINYLMGAAIQLEGLQASDLRVCSPDWTRTSNLPINSRLLCQLSYRGMLRVEL